MNGLWVTTLSAARAAVKALTSPDLPANEGFNRPITVIAPEGCVFNAGPGVPSFLCANVAQTILELVNRALHRVLPEKIPACSGGDVIGNGFYGIEPYSGNYWGTITPSIIGQGADSASDGDSYVMSQSAGASMNIPSEVLESAFPLFIEKAEFVKDSGGAGKYRGGLGSRLHLRLLAPATFYSFIEKGKSPHWGLNGGKAGLRNYALIEPKDRIQYEVLKTSGVQLSEGDRVTVTAGGGGGYGNPVERDPELVLGDVIDGYISLEHGRADANGGDRPRGGRRQGRGDGDEAAPRRGPLHRQRACPPGGARQARTDQRRERPLPGGAPARGGLRDDVPRDRFGRPSEHPDGP